MKEQKGEMAAMKRQLAATLGAVVLCVAAGKAAAGFVPTSAQAAPASGRAEAVPRVAASSQTEEAPTEALPAEETVYWLRESGGRLAVFVGEAAQPELVLEVYLNTLPEADQLALRRGIRVVGYSRLVAALEDYVS